MVDCGLTSHQQLRSYGDGTSCLSLCLTPQSTTMFMPRRCPLPWGVHTKLGCHGIQNVLQIYSAKLIMQHRFSCYVIQINFISTGLDCRAIDMSQEIFHFSPSKRKQFVLKLTSRISQEAHATKITALANLIRAQWSIL